MPKWLVLHLLEPNALFVPGFEPTESIFPESDCLFFVLINLFVFLAAESTGFGISAYFCNFLRLVNFLKVCYSRASRCSILSIIGSLVAGDEETASSVQDWLRFSWLRALGLPNVSKLQSRAKLLLECCTVLL